MNACGTPVCGPATPVPSNLKKGDEYNYLPVVQYLTDTIKEQENSIREINEISSLLCGKAMDEKLFERLEVVQMERSDNPCISSDLLFISGTANVISIALNNIIRMLSCRDSSIQ